MESSKTEVLSFDIDEYNSRECQVHNHGFYLGEKSKQDEIDELIDTIKTSAESEMYLFDELQKVKGERDRLQKRIDLALEKCYTGIRKQGGDYYLEVVQEILKGDHS